MPKSKIIRNLQASCNLLNPRQKRLYDFAREQAGPNLSDWLKALIEREMVRIELSKTEAADSKPAAVTPEIDPGIVKGFI